ncbi:MAG: dephospho-CoA kinase [Staphylococcus sp.]|nr:dephospho-CoA kinase [Staphylococcus sp.]
MLIAISGGIGSGKTVVSRIVGTLGHEVYDCDSRAAEIMDTDAGIKDLIGEQIHRDCILADGAIDRKRLAEIVFNDYDALQRLNTIVHAAVRSDVVRWAGCFPGKVNFVETAILYQSGLDKLVDEVWEVEAPVDLRVERVMARNGLSREQVLARIASQEQFVVSDRHKRTHIIINDLVVPLLPQIESLLSREIVVV